MLFESKYATPPVFMINLPDYQNVVFVLIHGDANGNVAIAKDAHVNLEILLKALLHTKEQEFKKKGINKIYTISCYGGRQIPFEQNGFLIMSAHNSKNKIRCSADSFVDDSFTLSIELLDGEFTV